jgi:hypothetical protein
MRRTGFATRNYNQIFPKMEVATSVVLAVHPFVTNI